MTAAVVILAAGASRRLGYPKQLVAPRGISLVRRAVTAAKDSRCDAVCVVTGAHAEAVAREADGAAVVHNEGWEEGIASSIRCGVLWAEAAGHDVVVLCVCDQPRLSGAHIDALLGAFCGAAVASRYSGTLGVPAVFGRAQFADLLTLTGDRGARRLLAGAAAVDWPCGAVDVDTVDDMIML